METQPSLAELEAQKMNQAKFKGWLRSISLKESGTREFNIVLKEDTAETKGQIHRLIMLLEEQKLGKMTFSIPVEMMGNTVYKWKNVSFETKITKWTRADKLTINGTVDTDCLLAMNEVLTNWKKFIEFFFEGHQQSID